MNGYIGNTDYDWYAFLRSQADLDEVNFWQPSGSHHFRAVPPGAPFFFRLKQPYYKIAGFGYLANTSILPDWMAWEFFDRKNGAPDFGSMRRRIQKYRRDRVSTSGEYNIGCLMISSPVFFDESEWISEPAGWARNIVSGATYDLDTGEGRRIWEACLERAQPQLSAGPLAIREEVARYGEPILVLPRLGQGTFRAAVTDAYGRACAVSGEHSLPVLDVAHIRPYSEGGHHAIDNGLLLRTDIHRLFDRGYVTVTADYRFEVSNRLREEWENGKTYYELTGKKLALPSQASAKPAAHLLEWHNEHVYLG